MTENPPAAPREDFFDWAWKHKLMMLPIVLAIVLSICGGFAGLVYVSALSGVRSHPFYQQAMALASEHPRVIEATGLPLTGGFITKGEIQVDDENQHGSADVEIPVTGPRGDGRLRVRGRLVEGEWVIDQLTASLANGQVIVVKDAP